MTLHGRIGGGDHARKGWRVVPHPRFRATVVLLLLSPYLLGCFSYSMVDPAALPTGAEVGVALNERGRAELLDVVGPGAQRIEGHVLAPGESQFTVAVANVWHEGLLDPVRWAGEPVTVRRELVSSTELRTLNRPRTAVAVGLAVVGLVLASRIAIEAGGSPGENGGRPPNGPVVQ